MGPTDAILGVISIFATSTLVGEVAMVPVDAGAIYLTSYLIVLIKQGSSHDCAGVTIPHPLEPWKDW